MPWVGEKNPYRIWLSEIILQQTTVDQGRDYYLRLRRAYPTVKALALAPEDEVLRHWQGLGYYARARNLHKAAIQVMQLHRGRFPSDFDTLIRLPGIGQYTAAAIASFAANERRAVVDGNVTRVLTRYFGITERIDKAGTKRAIQVLADTLLDTRYPGAYNQAVMDFGALQCRPRHPDCTACPLRRTCMARRHNLVHALPRKARAALKRHRYFNYLVIHVNGKYVLQKRTGRDIWNGLYEFPLVETRRPVGLSALTKSKDWPSWIEAAGGKKPSTYSQVLSHQVIHGRFFELTIDKIGRGIYAVPLQKLRDVALPRIMTWYLESRSLL